MEALGLRLWQPRQPRDDLEYIRRWKPRQPHDPESIRAEEKEARRVCGLLLFTVGFLVGLIVADPGMFKDQSPMVCVASLSLSLPSALSPSSPSIVSGNWSATLSVRNRDHRNQLVWDNAQVMLLYRDEFVAGTFLEPFRVDTRGNATLETGTVAFHREVGERAAQAIGMDSEDNGVMELEVMILYNDAGLHHWLGWNGFACRGLKVGFSSQNQSQVGLLLSGSPHKCK